MLFRDRLIPDKTFIYGYSRSKLTMEQLKNNVAPYLKVNFIICSLYINNKFSHISKLLKNFLV